jgi:uncharacterized protein (DUF2147 family)
MKSTAPVRLFVTSCLLLLNNLSSVAQHADDILGTWWNEERDGKVEVYKYGGAYYGRVVFVKFNTNPDGSSPKRDNNNPDPGLRSRIIQGTTILSALHWDAEEKEWADGRIYDTKSGNTYDCYARLQADGTLYFKGYMLGMRFIGRSTFWTRVK